MNPEDLKVGDHFDMWQGLTEVALRRGTFAEGEIDGMRFIALADVYVIECAAQGLTLPECPIIERTEDKRHVYCLRLPEDGGQR